MKVFVSSVRRGLEEERDSLPGLISALEHEPRRFEDYTALPMPSREACLRGVEDADAYLLLLGAAYGEPLPDTGKSPTEEEFTVAKRRGIPILAFRKTGVVVEPEQAKFISKVEDYRTGLFRAGFGSTPELLIEVARGLRELANVRAPLVWRPLASTVVIPWEAFAHATAYGANLVVHVVPVVAMPLPASSMAEAVNRLARCGRDHRLFGEDRALELQVLEDAVVAVARGDGRAPFAAVREGRSRTLSVASQLPSDTMGPILDQQDVSERLFQAFSIAADRALTSNDIAVAISLDGLQMLTEGSMAGLGRRTSVTLAGVGRNSDEIRLEPADQIPFSALVSSRGEVAEEFAARLMLRFRASRR